MHIYSQSTGNWWDDRGELLATGYSGQGNGKNNPKMQAIRNVGPIPRGLYIIGMPYKSKTAGEFFLPLIPSGHNAFGRTAFGAHGDSLKAPGTASEGCIILPRATREFVHSQNDRILRVIE